MKYVIGIDGGGTKTTAVLADEKGNQVKMVRGGASSPRNVGVEACARTLTEVVERLGRFEQVSKIVIGLASVEEQPYLAEKIEDLFDKDLRNKIEIVSDQLVAFRSGTDKKDGVVLIAGTGCVAHGWNKNREAKVSGWGWLEDKGSAFWVGQKAFQAVVFDWDGRGPKTKLGDIALAELGVKGIDELLREVYKDPLKMVPLFSIFCDQASGQGDKAAQTIMAGAGKALANTALTAVDQLQFEDRFPLVLVGSMFKSVLVLETVSSAIKKQAPEVEFIQPGVEPVAGAVKLALKGL